MTFPHDYQYVNSVAYSPDGSRIAIAEYDTNINVWNAETRMVEFVLPGHKYEVKDVAFSPCGQMIASFAGEAIVRLWDANSGKPGRVITTQARPECFSFSPNGQQLVIGCSKGLIEMWEVSTGKSRLFRSAKDVDIGFVSFSPIDPHVVIAGVGSTIEVWNVQSEEVQQTMQHGSLVRSVAFSSCGQWITACCGPSVWLWNRASGPAGVEWRHRATIRGFSGNVWEIAWKPQTMEFVTGCLTGSIRTWKLKNDSDEVSVQLIWGDGPAGLTTVDAVIVGAVGLSVINREVLLQRGAIDRSLSTDSI